MVTKGAVIIPAAKRLFTREPKESVETAFFPSQLIGRKTDCDNIGHSYHPKHALFSLVTVMELSPEYSRRLPLASRQNSNSLHCSPCMLLPPMIGQPQRVFIGRLAASRCNDGNHAHARAIRTRTRRSRAVASRGMCRDSNGGVIAHRQRRRSLALTQNYLVEQYFVILRS
jgi:hypothetical protein